MSVFKNKAYWKWAVLAFISGAAAAFCYFSGILLPFFRPETRAQVVLPEKIIDAGMLVLVQERYDICEKYGLPCGDPKALSGRERQILNGKLEADARILYSEADGWGVDWGDKRILFSRAQMGMCPYHGSMWHLEGLDDEDVIAIYVGPREVGQGGGLLAKTDIRLSRLPEDLRERVRSGSLVFTDYDEMVGVLDSLSEV
jgi:hypothetical protein